MATVLALVGATGSMDVSRTVEVKSFREALVWAMREEQRSAAFYRAVMARHGQVRPFVMVRQAGIRHQGMLEPLFERYGVEVPADEFERGESETQAEWLARLSVPPTFREACEMGVKAEEENVALFGELLKLEMPDDVRATFERLGQVSRENHLPAFRRAMEGAGRSGGGRMSAYYR